MLSFQKLDVYQRAIEFLALSIDIVERLPKGNRKRADQLSESAESVVRNIGEGAGRWTRTDSAKHYKIARGEAMESVASLDVLKLRRLISPEHYERGIELLTAVVSMLTKHALRREAGVANDDDDDDPGDVNVKGCDHVNVHVHDDSDDYNYVGRSRVRQRPS